MTTKLMIAFLGLSLSLACGARADGAADPSLNGVWILSSATCQGQGKAVEDMNSDLKRTVPAQMQMLLVMDGTTGSFLYNDPGSPTTDSCLLLIQGQVTADATQVTITSKYPVSIGNKRCSAGSGSATLKRVGNTLVSVGSDNKNICSEIDYTFSR